MLKNNGYKIISYVIATVILTAVILPMLIMLSVSFQTMDEIYSRSPVFIPETISLKNYIEAMQAGNWGRYFFNSIFITCTVVLISLIINSMTGFVFARFNFRWRNGLFILLLLGMMIPPQVTMIPVFSMITKMGLYDTYAGLMLPFLAGSFGVFLCRQFYKQFPRELDEAAVVDGCGKLSLFFRIYLPLGRPVLASLAVLKFTGTWNEYTWPLIMSRSSSDKVKTVQLALTMFRDESQIYWNRLMAATLVSSAVIYIIFIVAQRHFVSGILAGSVKG